MTDQSGFEGRLSELREIFERHITIGQIAEPLLSFDEATPSSDCRAFMEANSLDVVGVRSDGAVDGYAQVQDLSGGNVGNYALPIPTDRLLNATEPLLVGVKQLEVHPWVFVRLLGKPGGIVTRSDLKKQPVRMWLFGLVSLLEMEMTETIRSIYTTENWAKMLSPIRLKNARQIYEQSRQKNEELDLAACLQFADKADLVAKSFDVRQALGFSSKAKASAVFGRLQDLRNHLAHARGLSTKDWGELAKLAECAEFYVDRLAQLRAISDGAGS